MKKILNLMGILMLPILMTACFDDIEPIEVPPHAFVSFYHASPDAPGLDVFVDNTRVNNQAFQYATSLPYNRFRTGERHFRFTPFNAFNTLMETTLAFEENRTYSVFLTNEKANLNALLVEDNWTNPPVGKARIRSLHLSPDLPEVNIRIFNETDELVHEGSFETATDFDVLPEGTYTIEVSQPGAEEVLVSAANINIQPARIYTLILRGFQSPPGDSTNTLSLQLLTNNIIF